MRYIKNNFMAKLLMVGLFVICSNLSLNARFLLNGSDGGYPPTGGGSRAASIETYVVEGAAYFLKGYSDIQEFLELYELQDKNGIAYEEWQTVLANAMNNMSSAVQNYDQLIEKAEATPYNEEFISCLIAFDYTSFAKEQGLNSVIFEECEVYLKEGDITGMYKRISTKFIDIVDMLENIEGDLKENKITELSLIWRLNETCAELSLFGQYASRVFYAIMDK